MISAFNILLNVVNIKPRLVCNSLIATSVEEKEIQPESGEKSSSKVVTCNVKGQIGNCFSWSSVTHLKLNVV